MKTLSIIISLILFISVNLHAQLKYEGTIDSRYKTIHIDDGTIKYFKYNQKEKKVLIYNLDNSLWCTINLPLPKNHLLDENYVQIEFTINIIDESGKLILTVPGSNEMEFIESDGKKKLLIYKHLGKHFSNEEETIIYSL